MKDWSPRQTAGWLAKNYAIRVSHEAIYQIIRNDVSGELAKHCRHKMKYRHHWVRQTAKNIMEGSAYITVPKRPMALDLVIVRWTPLSDKVVTKELFSP